MSDQPASDQRKQPISHWIAVIILCGMSIGFLMIGIREINTKDVYVSRKWGPSEHVTGDAAVRHGIWNMVYGAIFLGSAIWNGLGSSSSSSSEKTRHPSAKTKRDRRDVGGKRNHL